MNHTSFSRTHLHLYDIRADTAQTGQSHRSSAIRHWQRDVTNTYRSMLHEYGRRVLLDGSFWRALLLLPMITSRKTPLGFGKWFHTRMTSSLRRPHRARTHHSRTQVKKKKSQTEVQNKLWNIAFHPDSPFPEHGVAQVFHPGPSPHLL
jgi:hypothetical protein